MYLKTNIYIAMLRPRVATDFQIYIKIKLWAAWKLVIWGGGGQEANTVDHVIKKR